MFVNSAKYRSPVLAAFCLALFVSMHGSRAQATADAQSCESDSAVCADGKTLCADGKLDCEIEQVLDNNGDGIRDILANRVGVASFVVDSSDEGAPSAFDTLTL